MLPNRLRLPSLVSQNSFVVQDDFVLQNSAVVGLTKKAVQKKISEIAKKEKRYAISTSLGPTLR